MSLLLEGQAVALPTETVYGLAGRIDRERAIKKIFQLKKRPLFDPLIIHCYNKNQALKYMSGAGSIIEKLLDRFSPGPLTVIAKKSPGVSPLITAGKATAAFRIPRHPLMRKILKALPAPLAAPSANLYGKASPVSARHVLSSFNGKVPVLDGGVCKKGLESTIVYPDISKKKIFILRPGIISRENLLAFLKKAQIGFDVEYRGDALQPGGQKSHYRPSVPLYILDTHKSEKEIRGFLSKKCPGKNLRELKLESSPHKTARLLYSRLRQLSDKADSLIFVRQTSRQTGGLWTAIWDRLHKASSHSYKI